MLSSDFPQASSPLQATSLKNVFFKPSLLEAADSFDTLFGYFCFHAAQRIDTKVVDDVRNFLFGDPDEARVGHDLVSLNIERGRDHGIPKYNVLREALGLQPYTSFAHFDAEAKDALKAAYNNDIDKVDAWVGGLAEGHVDGGMVGELFATIISRQFHNLMIADPFFYKRDRDLRNNEVLKDHVIDLDQVKLSDILRLNTGLLVSHEDNVMSMPVE